MHAHLHRFNILMNVPNKKSIYNSKMDYYQRQMTLLLFMIKFATFVTAHAGNRLTVTMYPENAVVVQWNQASYVQCSYTTDTVPVAANFTWVRCDGECWNQSSVLSTHIKDNSSTSDELWLTIDQPVGDICRLECIVNGIFNDGHVVSGNAVRDVHFYAHFVWKDVLAALALLVMVGLVSYCGIHLYVYVRRKDRQRELRRAELKRIADENDPAKKLSFMNIHDLFLPSHNTQDSSDEEGEEGEEDLDSYI